jgi:hypothetical protein
MRRVRLPKFIVIAIIVAMCVFGPLRGRARACPNCKEAVSLQPGESAAGAYAYNWSILLFLAVPFSLLGTGAFLVHRAAKRGRLPEL